MVKKITTDPDDLETGGEDHGVLAEAGLDTTAIGILSPQTAQVHVVLPQLLEEPDDEVVDDEVEPDDLRSGGIVIELPADQVDQIEQAAEAGAAGEDSELTAEIMEDAEPMREEPGDHPGTPAAADEDVIDVVVVSGLAGDSGRASDESTVRAEVDDEGQTSHHAEAGDPHAPEEMADAVEEPGTEAGPSRQPEVDGWRAAAAALAAEHASGAEPEPGRPDPVTEEFADPEAAPREPAAQPEAAPAERPHTLARLWAEETAAARAAEPSMHTEAAKPPQTTGALEMTARRLEDLGRNADRESSDLLTADRVLNPQRVPKAAPEGAWSEFVYGLTGGRLNLGDGRRARARKQLEARVAAALPGQTRFVPVLSRKGGVGKTTVTTLLGMALAEGREDRVIAIDANPDRGTLADRIGKRVDKTVRDLVQTAGDIRGFSDMSRFVARDETRLDVLASDADPRISQAFAEDDYRTVADVAEHFYSLVLTDTGTGIIHSVMSATLAHADQLVIVSGLSLDEVRLASETVTWLESNGYDDLARNAVVVLNQQSTGAPMVRLSELDVHFGSRVRAVVHLPYDAALATGSAIVYRELQARTRQAARELAARVVDGLREGRPA